MEHVRPKIHDTEPSTRIVNDVLGQTEQIALSRLADEYPKLFTASGGYENYGAFLHTQIEHFIQHGAEEDWVNVIEGNPGMGKTVLQNEMIRPLMNSIAEGIRRRTDTPVHLHFIGWDEIQNDVERLLKTQKHTSEMRGEKPSWVPNDELREFMQFIDSVRYTMGTRRRISIESVMKSLPDPNSGKGSSADFHYIVGFRLLQKVHAIRDERKPYTAIFIEKVGNTSFPGLSYLPGSKTNRWVTTREYVGDFIEIVRGQTVQDIRNIRESRPIRVTGSILTSSPIRLIDVAGRHERSFATEPLEMDILQEIWKGKRMSMSTETEIDQNTAGSEAVVYKGLHASLRLAQGFVDDLSVLGFSEDFLSLIRLSSRLQNNNKEWKQLKISQKNRDTRMKEIVYEHIESIQRRYEQQVDHPIHSFLNDVEYAANVTMQDVPTVLFLFVGTLGAASLSEYVVKQNVTDKTEYCVVYTRSSSVPPEKISFIKQVTEDARTFDPARGKKRL